MVEKSSKPKAHTKGKLHTVATGETLNHIALRYYGSAAKENWKIIYEANEDMIGEYPSTLRRGMELFIPDLDE